MFILIIYFLFNKGTSYSKKSLYYCPSGRYSEAGSTKIIYCERDLTSINTLPMTTIK